MTMTEGEEQEEQSEIHLSDEVSTGDPPISLLSGPAKKQRCWKTAVKEDLYNQEKTYSELENQQRYWGGGAVWGGGLYPQ